MERHGLPKKARPPVNLPPMARTRSRRVALHQCHELLQEVDIRKVDKDGLEVVGSPENSRSVTHRLSSTTSTEMQNNNPPAEHGDDLSDAPVPALRICGQLAKWTGNSTARQGEVGINSCIYFQALPGEIASSCLELHNEGNTAVFCSWQKLHGSSSISHLLPQRKRTCFYFNQSLAVILPGDTRQLDLMFKSVTPGLHTESWQLQTRPRLLQGASVQVTLMGLAVDQDTTAALRRHLETRLEATVTENFCRSLLYKILEGIQTPERPRTLAEFLMESPPSEKWEENESETFDLGDRLFFEFTKEQI